MLLLKTLLVGSNVHPVLMMLVTVSRYVPQAFMTKVSFSSLSLREAEPLRLLRTLMSCGLLGQGEPAAVLPPPLLAKEPTRCGRWL
jgi:hypothetical protein